MTLSEELFEDLEERGQFQNFVDITRKMNLTDNTDHKNFYQDMIDSFYGRYMELLQVNMENGHEWVFSQFYDETH